MSHFDVFNGDADGICALLQLRLAAPMDSMLITGVKRDIALLDRVAGQRGDSVTVLDISVAANRDALLLLLERGVTVEYFDHHFAGELPVHPGATFHIDTSPGVCTGVIVDRALAGRHRIWAVVAAFGDDLADAAYELAGTLRLDAAGLDALRDLGECIAYNAYGDTEADLLVHPAELYRRLLRCVDPFEFMRADPVYGELSETQTAGPPARAAGATPADARRRDGLRASRFGVEPPRARRLRQRARQCVARIARTRS